MSTVPDERREVPASDLQPGQHVHEFGIAGGIGQVEHAKPYIDSEGRACIALLLTPIGGGVPSLLRPIAKQRFRLATDAEIEGRRDGDRRRELAAVLVDLAELIRASELPIPRYRFTIGHACLESRADVERWAEFLGVEIEMSGRIPVARHVRQLADGPSLHIDMQGPSEPEPAADESSTGDTSPSVAGAGAGEGPAPSGPEGRDSGPDTPAEHCHVGAWKGAEPGSCGVECACGTTFDGFDSLAQAGELLDRHIARETATPMADCTANSTIRIEVHPTVDSDQLDAVVYTCVGHRPEVLASLVARGLHGRTRDLRSTDIAPCGHEVWYRGEPLAAPIETAAEGADLPASADAAATGCEGPDADAAAAPAAPDPVAGAAGVTPQTAAEGARDMTSADASGEGRSSKRPVRAVAVPAASSGEGGAAGITPDDAVAAFDRVTGAARRSTVDDDGRCPRCGHEAEHLYAAGCVAQPGGELGMGRCGCKHLAAKRNGSGQ